MWRNLLRYCRSFREDGANYGKCPSRKETCFDFKVHATITLESYIAAFKVTPASADDQERLRDLAENQFGLVILGDKGYTGEALWDNMHRQGICLMSLKSSGYKKNLQRKYGVSSFASEEEWRPYPHSLAGSWMQKKCLRKASVDYVPDYRTKW